MPAKSLIEELVTRWEEDRLRGEGTSVEELCRDHPELVAPLQSVIARRQAEGAEETSAWSTGIMPGPSCDWLGPARGREQDRDQDLLTEDINDGLGPPQGPGEIGRIGTFKVTRLLGAGGMGSVYEATDLQLGRSVALKVMRARLAGSLVARERFLREARAAAVLEHDHVVAIYQVGEDHGVPYLAMPLLHGQALSDRLQTGPPLSGGEVLRIGREIAEGLAAAHDHGLIHRDIKPANIWLEQTSGRVKILDFGLARSTEEAGRLTQDGTVLGTPAYMAPEQAIGGRQVDHRADLFSLGCVLYRMATGTLPFAAGNDAAMLLAITQIDPTPPRQLNPGVPAALNHLILRLLAKSPDARPQSARAVIEAIHDLEQPKAWETPPIAIDVGEDAPDSLVLRPSTHTRSRHRRFWEIPAVLAGMLLLLGGLLAGFGLPSRLGEQITNQGTLVLESPSPSVIVGVEQQGRIVGVLDPRAGGILRLKAGTYELVLPDTAGTLQLSTDRVTLRRGERKVVRLVPALPGSSGTWPLHLPPLAAHAHAHANSRTASRTTPSPSRNAASLMISGGLILIAPPPTPTGANSNTPDSTHRRTTSQAVS
jgi:serine/threonine protein kinase